MKKILALLIVITAVTAFAAVPAFSEEAATGGDLEFAKALNFVTDDEVTADKVMTRIELAEIFYNIIFPSQNIPSDYWGENDFPDVPAEKKHIAATVYGMGVMRGYSDTQFAPDDPVTFNQAVKAMVSFLGYEVQSQMIGGYPSGYLTQAARLQILPGASVSGDAQATYGGISTMLKKAIGVDIAIWNHTEVDGTAIVDVQEGVDYLEYYRNTSMIKGIVSGNYLTNISDDRGTDYFNVFINGEIMSVSQKAAGIQNKLGYTVYVYCAETSLGKEILYYEEGSNNVLDVNIDEIASATTEKISYYVSYSGAVDAEISKTANLIFNGSYLDTYTAADINPFTTGEYDGTLRLIDQDNDGVYDTVVVNAFKSLLVKETTDTKIYNQFEPSYVVDLSNYKERNIDIMNIEGEPMEPGSIMPGQIVNVCYDKEGNIKRIIVSKDSLTGVVEEVEYAGNKISVITVSGGKFEVSGAVKLIDSQNRIAPGVFANVYFNSEGKIAIIDVDGAYINGYTLGYLVDAALDGNFSTTLTVMIFEQDGTMTTLTANKNLNINGKTRKAEEFMAAAGTSGERVLRQVVLYKKMVDEDVLTDILFPDTSGKFIDGLYEFPTDDNASYRSNFNAFGSYITLSTSVIRFSVPGDADRDDYKQYRIVTSIRDDLKMTNVKLYGTKSSGIEADALVINAAETNSSIDSRAPIFMITKISTVVFDGEEKTKIEGSYVDGTTYKSGSFVMDTEKLKSDLGGALPEVGDVIRTGSFETSGECIIVSPVFDYSEKKLYEGNVTGAGMGTSHRFIYGKVIDKEGKSIKVELANPDKAIETHYMNSYKIMDCKTDRDGNIISAPLSDSNCILDERYHPGDGSNILIYSRGGSPIAAFVFN